MVQQDFLVCPEWAVTWWWKSTTGLAVGTVSWGQVRPSWGGVWSKPKAKSRSDEQKSHIRHMQSGRACYTKRSPILPELCGVNDNLVRLGINNSKAWEWANSRKGYWRISNSHILHKSLTNEYLASVGYDDILNRYKVLHSNYWTAVYRTVRTVVWEVGFSING